MNVPTNQNSENSLTDEIEMQPVLALGSIIVVYIPVLLIVTFSHYIFLPINAIRLCKYRTLQRSSCCAL